MQRYIVFLNDRTISICQDKNESENHPDERIIAYKDKSALADEYKDFYKNLDYAKLTIIASDRFVEACEVFNKLFKRVEAAGGLVKNEKDEFLFIMRLGKWDLPKGKLHKKESIPDGALREVTEETGLTGIEISGKLPSTFHIYTDRKGREILKETFWFRMRCSGNQKLVPQTEEDITEVRWFTENELFIPLQNTYASIHSLMEQCLA